MKLNELMELCTTLQTRVLDLERTKTTQAPEITSLKKRVKKLEKKQRLRTHKLKRLYKVGLTARVDSSKDEPRLVSDQDDAEMFDVNDLHGEDVFVEKEVADKEVSAAREVNAASIATTDKGKAIMIEEPLKLKKKEQIRLDEEATLKLQAELQINADYQMAERLQVEEQKELTDEEKVTLFMQLFEKRRKFFAAKRAEEKRNKPLTQDQQRKIMCTYLKNVEGKKLKDLKNKSSDSIQKMFDRALNRVNTFVDFKKKLVEGSSKRAGEELTQESAKNQKVNDKETAELKQLMKIIPDEEEVGLSAIVESSEDEGLGEKDASKQGMIDDIDVNEDITLVSTHDEQMFDADQDLGGEEVFVAQQDEKVIEKEVDAAQIHDDVQAKIDADYELAQRIQAKEQDELTDAEKTKLFMQFLKKRRKFFAAKRAEEKRNRPPTRAQQRSIMSMKKVNTFVDFKTKLVEESSKKAEAEITQEDSLKRAGDELGQERSKKQKVKDDKESKELKKCLEIIPDDRDDVTIDATPLSSNKMLKFFDREDLEVLWRLFKARFEKIKQVDHVD
nr:hypothetical protein [Tanacetum cinerariifolium]